MYYTSPYQTHFFADRERDLTTIPLAKDWLYDDDGALLHTDNGDRIFVAYNGSIFDDSGFFVYTDDGYQIFDIGTPYVYDDDGAYAYDNAGNILHEG